MAAPMKGISMIDASLPTDIRELYDRAETLASAAQQAQDRAAAVASERDKVNDALEAARSEYKSLASDKTWKLVEQARNRHERLTLDHEASVEAADNASRAYNQAVNAAQAAQVEWLRASSSVSTIVNESRDDIRELCNVMRQAHALAAKLFKQVTTARERRRQAGLGDSDLDGLLSTLIRSAVTAAMPEATDFMLSMFVPMKLINPETRNHVDFFSQMVVEIENAAGRPGTWADRLPWVAAAAMKAVHCVLPPPHLRDVLEDIRRMFGDRDENAN